MLALRDNKMLALKFGASRNISDHSSSLGGAFMLPAGSSTVFRQPELSKWLPGFIGTSPPLIAEAALDKAFCFNDVCHLNIVYHICMRLSRAFFDIM